jgi:hypothetical protein
MLKHRTVRAEIRGESMTMKVRRGCPQGCVLSPLLWNMVIETPGYTNLSKQNHKREIYFIHMTLAAMVKPELVYIPKLLEQENFLRLEPVTVFQTEVFAILACAQNCINMELSNIKISICSDSKASLLSLYSYTITSSLVFQCLSTLPNISQSNVAELVWVPGHLGKEGNENADELARAGSGTLLCGPEPCLQIFYTNGTIADKGVGNTNTLS